MLRLTRKAVFGGSRTVNSMNVSAIGNGSCTRCSSPTAYAPATGMSRCIEAGLGFVPNADLLGVTACPAGQFRVIPPNPTVRCIAVLLTFTLIHDRTPLWLIAPIVQQAPTAHFKIAVVVHSVQPGGICQWKAKHYAYPAMAMLSTATRLVHTATQLVAPFAASAWQVNYAMP